MSYDKEKPPYANRVLKAYPITDTELRSIKSYNSMCSLLFSAGTFIVGNNICNQEAIPGAAIITSGICFLLSSYCYWQRYKILSDIEKSADLGMITTNLFT